MGAWDRDRTSRGRSTSAGLLVMAALALALAACGTAILTSGPGASPGPSASAGVPSAAVPPASRPSAAPTAVPTATTAPAPTTPAPTPPPTPVVLPASLPPTTPVPMPTPVSSFGPSAEPTATPLAPYDDPRSDALLAQVQAVLRPMNLRLEGKVMVDPPIPHPLMFAFEMVNTSSTTLAVPRLPGGEQPAAWFGTIQAWLEPLGTDDDLSTCLPWAERKGSWYAMGGSPSVLPRYVLDHGIAPGEGTTMYRPVPSEWTACAPAGRYRLHVELRPLVNVTAGDAIATTSVDFEITRSREWVTTLAEEGISGTASLDLSPAGTGGTSVLTLAQMTRGTTVSSELRADDCLTTGPLLVAPPPFTTTSGGTYRQRWVFTVHSSSARRAIAAGSTMSIRVTVGDRTACAFYTAVTPAAGSTSIAPTAGAGPFLETRLADGRVVRASSETYGGFLGDAFDGDTNRIWNAGRSPVAWIEVDLGRDVEIAALRLDPAQTPTPGDTVHRIYGRADGDTAEILLAELAGTTEDGVWVMARLDHPRAVRYVRIETVVSPSWVAWREIELLDAGGRIIGG